MFETNSLLVDSETIGGGFLDRVRMGAKDRAYYIKKEGKYEPVLWEEVYGKVLGIFSSLRAHGVTKGDRVAIMAHTAPEWNLVDIAILSGGAITIPVYPSSTPEDTAHIIKNSGAKFIFVDDIHQYEKIEAAQKKLGTNFPVASFKPIPGKQAFDLASFMQMKDRSSVEKEFEAAVRAVKMDDIASIVYTSGTTGVPKGVVLTHYNFTSCLLAVIMHVRFVSSDCLLTFLPFSHIFGRIESLAPIFCGIAMGFAENMTTVAVNIQELKPTVLVSVPRIYEKIYARIMGEVASGSAAKQKIFHWAQGIGREVACRRSEKQPIPAALQVKYAVADKLVFSKIRAKLGGRIKLTASGGAPLARDICEFFHGCGIKILEGYGLTETLGPIIVNHPDNYRFGTVGTPIGNGEVKIASDGEILLRGSMVSPGYYNDPEATKAAFLPDGWFCSGDIGEIDDRGFLKITDRKKELIITAGGKNIAPQKIENLVKLSPYISNCMAYGDKQKYIVALVTLDPDAAKKWAESTGKSANDLEALARSQELNDLVAKEIEKANKELANYESVKKFHIVAEDWSPENGMLTPSLKLKRKVIIKNYQSALDALY